MAAVQGNIGGNPAYGPASWLVGDTQLDPFGPPGVRFAVAVDFVFNGPSGSVLDSVSVPMTYIGGRPFLNSVLGRLSGGVIVEGLYSSFLNQDNASPGAFVGTQYFSVDRNSPSSCSSPFFGAGCFNAQATLLQGQTYRLVVSAPDGSPSQWGWLVNGIGQTGSWSSSTGGAFGSAGTAATPAFQIGYTAAVPEPASWALMLGGMALAASAARRRSRVA